VREPHGFMRYSRGTQTFWFVGPTIILCVISFFNKPKPQGIFGPPLRHIYSKISAVGSRVVLDDSYPSRRLGAQQF
jgi:hypothetical protein